MTADGSWLMFRAVSTSSQSHITDTQIQWLVVNVTIRLVTETTHSTPSKVGLFDFTLSTSLQPAVVASIAGVWPSSSTASRVPFSFSSRTTTVVWPAIWAMLSLVQWRAVRPRSPFTHTPASSQPCNKK